MKLIIYNKEKTSIITQLALILPNPKHLFQQT
jgi:hypothetical protein